VTAGYSRTPLPKKLGVKEGTRLAFAARLDIVQKHGLASGLVDTKICAIDETWSGLRFSRRKAG